MGLFKKDKSKGVLGRQDKDKQAKTDQDTTVNNAIEPAIDDDTVVDENGAYEELRADMPSANSDGRDGKNQNKLIKMGVILVSMVIMLAGLAMTMSNYSESKEQKKAEEAQKEADKHKQVVAETGSSIKDEQDAMKASQALPPPIDATNNEDDDSDSGTADEPIVAPVVEPRPQEPKPNYNQYNDGNDMVAGRDYTPPAPIVQPSAPPISQFVDEENEQVQVPTRAEPPKPSDFLVDVYGAKKAVATSNTEETGLGESLKSSQIANGTVSKRSDKSMLLMRGTTIPCVLITKIDSTYQGFATCQLIKDVYSANGAVLLMERGSKVFGEQNIQMSQGKARVSILWSRIETPKGVSVSLDSPAIGGLGEMGIDAKVNNHYWKRFSGAIMLSLIQDGFAVARSHLEKQNENGNNTTITNTTNTAESMSEEVLKNTINIPPTATVNQGTVINIMVARDVDFAGIYELRRR